jgi:hypothetical protein
MTFSSFSSLLPAQRSRAASLFQDELFGSLPEDYTYEIDAATGQLTGIRTRIVQPARSHGKRRIVPIIVHSSGHPILSPFVAKALVDLFVHW